MADTLLWTMYAAPLVISLGLYLHLRRRRESRFAAILERSVKAGLTEPTSIHPSIDPRVCVGSGSCVRACPEKTLGIVDGKARMVNPTVCIGHGACAAACPVEAITLVFGTERRGIDIPYVKPNFETNVTGIYIAGELGGMGLIRKAAEQGRQAIGSISRTRASAGELDVVIIGAGPAGLSATLGAMESKLRFVTLEQEDSLGGTIYHYPRNKVVSSQPIALPIVGKVALGAVSKESLLEFWKGVVERAAVPINFGERFEKITPAAAGFVVKTARGEYSTRSVLLAIGRRGTPRKLGVPGEEQAKVVYRLVDPEQYRGKKVLVVGGGDSAVEAALAVASEPATHVTLSYRGEAFSRLKTQNRERLEAAERGAGLSVLLRSSVIRLGEKDAEIEHEGKKLWLDNDAVIVCAGGLLPTQLLKDIGVQVETKYGTA